ncbi:cytochrome c3 family protein [bacterium]|nr:cytochrome c3 family protein [bacterium]
MRKLIIIFIFLAVPVFGQTDHHKAQADCSLCHACQAPSIKNPCLSNCPRNRIAMSEKLSTSGPSQITMDNFKEEEDIYSAVVFPHLAHANMAGMSGGCEMCHHHEPTGEVSSCKKCHEAERQRTDLHKPDLKGAYHRQCMDCHSLWDNNDSCTHCHAVNGSAVVPIGSGTVSTDNPVAWRIAKPDKKVYNTRCLLGKSVTFSHHRHDLPKVSCGDCHQNRSCVSCHSRDKVQPLPVQTKKERHQECSGCHDTRNNCTQCHKAKEAEGTNPILDKARIMGMDCSECHNSNKKGRKPKDKLPLVHHHLKNGIACLDCHDSEGDPQALTTEKCLSCHGSFDDVAAKTAGMDPDPHNSPHYGKEQDCELCHRQHKESENFCSECHEWKLNVP